MKVCECGRKAVAKLKCKTCYNRAWREAKGITSWHRTAKPKTPKPSKPKSTEPKTPNFCECGKEVARGKCKPCYNKAYYRERYVNPKTPDVPDETKHFTIDKSDHSVVIVCKSCGWRCVELNIPDALYRLFRHSARYEHGIDNYYQRVLSRFRAYGVAVPKHLEEEYEAALRQRASDLRRGKAQPRKAA